MKNKPAEAATLAALIDNHAALSDFEALERMGNRALRKTKACKRGAALPIWSLVTLACAHRGLAVRMRVSGNIQQALDFEDSSERALKKLYFLARGNKRQTNE